MHPVFATLFVSSGENTEGASGHLELCGVASGMAGFFL
jgi:hypothetical protein